MREVAAAARDRDRADRLALALVVVAPDERHRERVNALHRLRGRGSRRAGSRTRTPAARPPRAPRAEPGSSTEAHLLELARVHGHHAAGVGVAGLDRGPHGQVDHPLAVEAGAERLADPPDRVLELAPLALDLVDVGLELLGHRVELLAERGELVVALDRDALAEVAAPEPARGLEEAVDLALERAHDEDRRSERRARGTRSGAPPIRRRLRAIASDISVAS